MSVIFDKNVLALEIQKVINNLSDFNSDFVDYLDDLKLEAAQEEESVFKKFILNVLDTLAGAGSFISVGTGFFGHYLSLAAAHVPTGGAAVVTHALKLCAEAIFGTGAYFGLGVPAVLLVAGLGYVAYRGAKALAKYVYMHLKETLAVEGNRIAVTRILGLMQAIQHKVEWFKRHGVFKEDLMGLLRDYRSVAIGCGLDISIADDFTVSTKPSRADIVLQDNGGYAARIAKEVYPQIIELLRQPLIPTFDPDGFTTVDQDDARSLFYYFGVKNCDLSGVEGDALKAKVAEAVGSKWDYTYL